MKNKIKTCLFALIIMGVITLGLTYNKKNEVITKTKKKKQSNLAIMIKEEGASGYTRSSSKDIPIGNYVLNEKKTHCENNSKILSYDNSTGKVKFSFIGSDRCYLYFDYEEPNYIKILNNNGGKAAIEAKDTPDFSTISTTNDGMYATEDDLGTSYYFRGAVDNNWVQFGKDSSGNDIYWRIIRINGDGSIRMIYSGTTAPDSSTATVMTGTGTQISTSKFYSSIDKAEYVGYMYTEGEQHGNSTPSTIKTAIDNWYVGTTLKDNPLVSQDQIFCNDRSASTSDVAYSTTSYTTLTSWNSTGTTYYYGTRGRLNNSKSPMLTCPTESDKFTSKQSSIGNKVLDYPVGLITADEVAMAGAVAYKSNTSYYLHTNQDYWTGSPFHFESNFYMEGAYVDGLYTSQTITPFAVTNSFGVRPVISLSPKAKLSGSGTYNDIYTVS